MKYSYFLLISTFISLVSCTDKKDVDKLKFLQKGNRAYADKNLKEAIRFYDEAILKDSSFVDAWNNKGLSLFKQKKYDEAIFCFDQAINHKPTYGSAVLNNARAHLAVHQYFSCLEHLDNLETIWPDTSVLHFTRGLVHAEMGENETAISDFSKALKTDPANAEIQVNIANLYYHQQQADSAIKYIGSALKLDPTQPYAFNILAMVYVELENYEDALVAINSAISFNNKDAFFVNNKGYILLKLKRLEEAEEEIIQSMKMDPYNAWVYRNLGLVRYDQERYSDAIRLLTKAKDMDESIDDLDLDLVKAFIAAGDIVKACDLLSTYKFEDKSTLLFSKQNCQ